MCYQCIISCKLTKVTSHTFLCYWQSMAIQENFVTCFPWHWQFNDHKTPFRKTLSHASYDTDYPMTMYGRFGYYREFLCRTRTCKVWCLFSVFLYPYNDDPMKFVLVSGLLRLTRITSYLGLQSFLLYWMVTVYCNLLNDYHLLWAIGKTQNYRILARNSRCAF